MIAYPSICWPCLAVVWTLAAGSLAAQPETGEADEAGKPSRPTMPAIELAPLDGFADARSYREAVAEKAAGLAAEASQAKNPERRVEGLLNAANLILANVLEPACTARLLRIDEEQVPIVVDDVRADLKRAEGLLTGAEQAMEQNGPNDAKWKRWRDRIDILRAFADGQRVFLIPDEGPDAPREARRAASRLAILLEHENPQVLSAAALWQAVLRSGETDPAPALSLLEPALWDLPRKRLPFAFYGRLLRCRLLARQGGYATSLALLTRVEERCSDWFADDEERDNAVRTAKLVSWQVLQAWYNHLTDPTDVSERKWCAERMEKLKTASFGETGRTVFRLNPAIPLFTAPPDAANPEPKEPLEEE